MIGVRTPVPARWYLAFAFALLTLVGTACDSPTDGDAGESTISIFLTDAPGDVDSVWVQVDDVVLAGGDGNVSLLDEPTGLINVTALAESTETLIEGVEIEAGQYHDVRFVLGGAVLQAGDEVYTFGGAEHPEGTPATGTLQCPSCAQSGIKVKITGGMEVEEGANGLLLDFDVSQSFGHVAGQSGKWVMHPVILGAAAEPAEILAGGAGGEISGTVELANEVSIPACGGADRTLASFVPAATSTVVTDDEGNPLVFTGQAAVVEAGFAFSIDVLTLDVFTLGYDEETTFGTEKLVWTASATPTTVTVDADNTEVGGVVYTVTGAACESVTP